MKVNLREKLGLKKTEKQKTERERVEERREEVLAQGRKFKYPLQYAKHKMMLYTMMIAGLALILFVGAGYVALYQLQVSNDVLYRLTRILPVMVAEIDGEGVRYSDYLMIYKSTIKPVEQQGQLSSDKDAEVMKAHYQRTALTEAENYTYALKLGRELGVQVDESAVTTAIDEHRKAGGVERSLEGFTKILEDNFDLSMEEYRRMVYLSLMKAEVAKKVDVVAEQVAAEVETRLAKSEDLPKIAEAMGQKVIYEATGGLVDKLNVDGGRATVAMKLNQNEISKKFMAANGDGYYFVKLLAKTETSVNYVSVKIPLTELTKRLEKVREEGKVKELIRLKEE